MRRRQRMRMTLVRNFIRNFSLIFAIIFVASALPNAWPNANASPPDASPNALANASLNAWNRVKRGASGLSRRRSEVGYGGGVYDGGRPSLKNGFDLFISRDEMNRTLGILAEMNYVDGGIINSYSTKFPYRIAANITHIFFTWLSHVRGRKVNYSIRAIAENFDILPVVHLAPEGFVPEKLETFAVEYRCAGSRAGQFPLTLHFNVSWPSATQFTYFTLKQEKICASKDGRRALGGFGGGGGGGADASQVSMGWSLNRDELLYLTLAIGGALILLCAMLVCVSVNASRKCDRAGGLAPMMGAGAAAHSFYTAAAMLGNKAPLLPSPPPSSSSTARVGQCASSAANAGTTPTTKRTILFDDTVAVQRPFLLDYDSDNRPQPLTSTPYAKARVPKLPKFDGASSERRKIIFERRGNLVDINHSLVELNADRNLFALMPQIELEGTFGEIRWANWRQTGIGESGDVDDEEDDANEDTALICKTLKHGADRAHFETFLRDALMLHNVPAHPNLAQVVAAATFGNFKNPNSVTDFPLICYRHSGFGILKKFLYTCRGINGAINAAAAAAAADASQPSTSAASANSSKGLQRQNTLNPTLRTHDLASIGTQVLKALQHLHTFGIIHKDVATRNCLISEVPLKLASSMDRLYVQLCDAALSKDLFPDEYAPVTVAAAATSDALNAGESASTSAGAAASAAKLSRSELRPIKWMAPETIRGNVFNSASDIWSYGIFVWELFTCGQLPFADIAAEDVELAIASGARPTQPYNCPDEMYGIMFSCWNHDPLQRPSTEQLLRVIGEFTHQLRKYI